jgi:hypothetical protein
MKVQAARAIAERAHGGQLDAGGTPIIEHVRRVAKATPGRSRSVAWLHEVLEWTSVREEQLMTEGLTEDELRALRLLTRPPGERSEVGYLGHIQLIAHSAGRSGDLARDVKQADLEDRMRHRAVRGDGWSPPYERGLEILSPVAKHHDGLLRAAQQLPGHAANDA